MSDSWTVWREFWDAYAKAFGQPLEANGLLSGFVTNPNVTGAYAEAWIHSMAKNMLGNRFRISTGAVVQPTDRNHGLQNVPQCDLIVWDPSEMPAVFEAGDFALVPLCSARAIIEVKRTAKKDELVQQLKQRPRGGLVLGLVVSHPTPLIDYKCDPNWLNMRRSDEPPMTRLLDASNKPDTDGILAFIYFLAQVAGHNRTTAGGARTQIKE